MKHHWIKKLICAVTAILALCACKPKGQEMIGPRTEDAWKEWEKKQAELKATWEGTDLYAYVETIRNDLSSVNANVVFKDDFSLDSDSPEKDALLKLYEDMNGADETPDAFLARLKESQLRWSIGGMLDLDAIDDKGNGEYEIILLDYPTPDALMNVYLTIKTNEDGSFSTEFE